MNPQIQMRYCIRQFLIGILILLPLQAGLIAADDLSGSTLSGLFSYQGLSDQQNEIVVRFADDALPQMSGPRTTRAIRSSAAEAIVRGAAVSKEYDGVVPGLTLVKLPAGVSAIDAVVQFNQSGSVLYAEPNYRYRFLAVPNDPDFSKQWPLNNTGQNGGTVGADIKALQAWDIQTGSRSIIVAVADSGVNYRHPDLIDNMWRNAAEDGRFSRIGVDDDNNGYIDDVFGYDFLNHDPDPNDDYYHGTFVAGIIGATGNNAMGVSGVCWNASIMALKIGDKEGVNLAAAIEAIAYATAKGAKIINASWGSEEYSQALKDAIDAAGRAGVLVVAAAGNDSSDNDISPFYPASYTCDNIISVLATDRKDKLASESNFGATSVDVGEPGQDIYSTCPTYQTASMKSLNINANYSVSTGTSLASSHVSGACALLWSQYPTLSYTAVKQILMQTVNPTLPGLCLSGGRINLQKALTVFPSGAKSRVLNTRDYLAVPAKYYSSIQSAINDANDGDVLIVEAFANDANSVFAENINFHGKAITLRSGSVTNPNDPNIYPQRVFILGISASGSVVTFASGEDHSSIIKGFTISWGSSDYGGGISCDQSSPTIEDCIIKNNFAKYYGGGIDCYYASPVIKSCTIIGNQAFGVTGTGGAINCEEASPDIINCNISNNIARNIGAAVACYDASPKIFNCFITNNSSTYASGVIDLEYSWPAITNCTILTDDAGVSKSGGIFAYQGSLPLIQNCILWGNGDDLFNCTAKYSTIENGDKGRGNISSNPLFLTGPRGKYYLTQIAAGQMVDSPCANAGNPDTSDALRAELTGYTTRTDGLDDTGVIDIGAHYATAPAELLTLTLTVVDAFGNAVDPNLAKGSVQPNSGTFRKYEVVRLTAQPVQGYRLVAWTGTDNDTSKELTNTITMQSDAHITVRFEQIPLYELRTSVIGGHGTILPNLRRGQLYLEGTVVQLVATPDQSYMVKKWTGTDNDAGRTNTNTVTMSSNKMVTIEFRQPKTLHVPGQYRTINDAMNATELFGDKVIVAAGTYNETSLDFNGKGITVASEYPDDPCSVAATIINCMGVGRAFIFQKGEGHDSVVDGFTIINGSAIAGPNTPIDSGGTGTNGQDGLGGAIACFNGSSPTLSNLNISNCVARGRNGENATAVIAPYAPPGAPGDPADAADALPDPDPPEPNPADPNAAVDGITGENGADGQAGAAGANGLDGAPGNKGGDGGDGLGGAMYFDANSAPIILNCKIDNCQAIGGDGGTGGQGQNGPGHQSETILL